MTALHSRISSDAARIADLGNRADRCLRAGMFDEVKACIREIVVIGERTERPTVARFASAVATSLNRRMREEAAQRLVEMLEERRV